MGEIVISSDRVRTVHCRNGSVLIRSRDSGWKFFHPGRMVTEGTGLVVISFGIDAETELRYKQLTGIVELFRKVNYSVSWSSDGNNGACGEFDEVSEE